MRAIHWIRVTGLLLMLPGMACGAGTFRAGAGQSDIQTTPDMFPVAEFSGQHDPVSARVLVLDDGAQRIALLTVDTPSIQDPSVAGWKAIVAGVAGINTDHALVVATHDTSSPHITTTGTLAISAADHGMAPGAQNARAPAPPTAAQMASAKAYASAVDEAVRSATTRALASLQPVQVGFGVGTSRINISTDLLTPKGWTNDLNDEGFTDPSLALIRFSSPDGQAVAWLMDYAVRPAIMERSRTQAGGALISGDLIGVARNYLEQQDGSGATALFLMGAANDQQPLFTAQHTVFDKQGNSTRVDIHEAGFTLVDLIGERLGSDAVRVDASIKTSATPTKLRLVRQSTEVATQARQQPKGAISPTGQKVAIPFTLLQIGDVVIVGTKHELNATTGVQIRSGSPFPHTLFAAMVDGSNGSLPDMSAYDRQPSGLNSFYVRGSAEAVVSAIEKQLKQLHDTR